MNLHNYTEYAKIKNGEVVDAFKQKAGKTVQDGDKSKDIEIAKAILQQKERDGTPVIELPTLEDFDFCKLQLKEKREKVTNKKTTLDFTEGSEGHEGH